jgi:quinate dehydrogenase (quinone)
MQHTHTPPSAGPARSRITTLFGIALFVFGLPLVLGGAKLAWIGGSFFYLLAGVALAASGAAFMRGSRRGVWIYLALALCTVVWALLEVGLQFWPLVPRLSGILVLLIPVCLLAPRLGAQGSTRGWRAAAALSLIAVVAGAAGMFVPHGVIRNEVARTLPQPARSDAPPGDWRDYGRTPKGTRFAPIEQITAQNVSSLKVAWTFRTGELAGQGAENQNTPLQVGDTLYICTPLNKVFALNAETGEQRWQYDPKVTDLKVWSRCRGVSYYESAPVQQSVAEESRAPTPQSCQQRVILSTLDARLIALDAKTGKPCEDFGTNGTVNLQAGMGEVKPTYYMGTSAVTVADGLIVVGGWVYDNLEVQEPSGVIRAFDAKTGELSWAWDLGNPAITRYPPEGQTYTRGTPNMWSTAAYDEKLGLIYLPLGNSTPDYWGGHRSPASNHYASSIVALDIKTGRERWAYQTVHHDIWDYDLPAQPALYDIPGENGESIPALIQVTKTGNIFVLDRRTGKPITEVQERPVPQQELAGDRTAPTQPYSVGMPYIGQPVLKESDMWGATLFDQLLCRIEFKSLRYEGAFTPTGVTPSLQNPGNFGGMNWGSASINEDTGTMIVNDIRIPLRIQLMPSANLAIKGDGRPHSEFAPQRGTPFAVKNDSFMSVLNVPCQAPPYGTVSGIDLKTRKVMWQIPAGTLQDTAMSGIKLGAPIPLGLPSLGGPLTTRSGLVFFSGTQDYYLRALDQLTGKELWKGRLPVGAQATPMTYISPTSQRQFVVVSAGGARSSPDRGDYVIAYALPKASD